MSDYRDADGYCSPPTMEDIIKCTYRDGLTKWATWCDYRSLVSGQCLRELKQVEVKPKKRKVK